MRQRSEIIPNSAMSEKIGTSGKDPQSINVEITVELLLDIRQISAAQFVIANGGTLTTPSWMIDLARGE